FFFQAEDGIRDGHVTGVQTCALPIFYFDVGVERPIDLALVQLDLPRDSAGQPQQTFREGEPVTLQATVQAVGKDLSNALVWHVRSEERRVGKEWRGGRARARQKEQER